MNHLMKPVKHNHLLGMTENANEGKGIMVNLFGAVPSIILASC
jgi:hypothetical protein